MRWLTLTAALSLALASSDAPAALVWTATFDASPDGVVDVFDNNPGKVMVGGAAGGKLPITQWDVSTGNTIDKAGRPLGSTRSGTQSFSALYTFRWSALNAQTTEAWEAAGFVGSASVGGTGNYVHQFIGAVLQHSKEPTEAGNDYLVRLNAGFGGNHPFGFKAGPLINLGPNAPNNTYHLSICYNGFTHVLTMRLADTVGNRLGSLVVDFDTDVPGFNTANYASLQVDHLGWSDYAGNGLDRVTTWEVDALAYYNDANGACNALPAEPTGACCDPATGGCSDTTNLLCQGTACSGSSCTTGQGVFQGAGSACASTNCPQPPVGACCLPDGTCAEGQTELQCTDALGTWQDADSTCAQVECPQPPPLGACCLIAEGTCAENITEADCTAGGAAQGIWQGEATTCAQTSCPAPATGACCSLDGTCAVTTLADCANHWEGPGTDCTTADICVADAPTDYVWLSTFDSDADQVVHVSNCQEPFGTYENECYIVDCANPACSSTKDMIGPAADGRVLIDVRDNQEPTPYVPDKAGRLVGASAADPLRSTDSFSVLYQFNWSQLYQNDRQTGDPGAYEFPAFFGSQWSDADPRLPTAQSRQVLGARIIHWKDALGNYMLDLGIDYGGALSLGLPNTAYQSQQTFAGQVTNLGPYAEGKYYQLAMGWDGATGRFTVKLYDSLDNLLAENSGVIATVYTSNGALEVGSMRMTHVGWIDYTSSRADNFDTLWQMDRLALFDTPYGAFREPLAPGACCLVSGDCLDNQTLEECGTAGGTWRGSATTCGEVTCPLPACNDPFADVDNDGDVDSLDFASFQRCHTGPAGEYDPPTCHCFDRDANGVIDHADFTVFQQCGSGSQVPADPACDD